MENPKIDYVRQEVSSMLSRWQKISDCLAGENEMKAAGDLYLPRPNPDDRSSRNEDRFLAYLERAVFYPVAGYTLRGLTGQAFLRDPEIESPPSLDLLFDDADGSGVGLIEMATDTLSSVISFGRAGLLVDYPFSESPVSRADVETMAIGPNILLYDPWRIINWRTVKEGSKNVLRLVVLEESYASKDEDFEMELGTQWRVLRLDGDGYSVTIYRKEESGYVAADTYFPVDSKGKRLQKIPFLFVGSDNNDEAIDKPPIEDLVELNVALWRNSADYEDSCYLVGQPTPWASGLTQTWVDKYFVNGQLQIGSRAVVPLPEGGSFGIAQVGPNTMIREAMEDKFSRMRALGAKLIQPSQTQKTATETRIEKASEISTLGRCCRNVSAAFARAMELASAFAGDETEIVFKIDPDSELNRLTVEERQELTKEWQAGAISFTELRSGLRASGVATQSDEEAKAEIDSSVSYSAGGIQQSQNVDEGEKVNGTDKVSNQ